MIDSQLKQLAKKEGILESQIEKLAQTTDSTREARQTQITKSLDSIDQDLQHLKDKLTKVKTASRAAVTAEEAETLRKEIMASLKTLQADTNWQYNEIWRLVINEEAKLRSKPGGDWHRYRLDQCRYIQLRGWPHLKGGSRARSARTTRSSYERDPEIPSLDREDYA